MVGEAGGCRCGGQKRSRPEFVTEVEGQVKRETLDVGVLLEAHFGGVEDEEIERRALVPCSGSQPQQRRQPHPSPQL
jgi:hypothetical protein